MDVNSYLKKLAGKLKVDDEEKKRTDTSIAYLKKKAWEKFQEKLSLVDVFGSYNRETKLPELIDKESDVDIMLIFKSGEFQPQTYLNWLKDFSEKSYPRSDVSPDFPTIAIEIGRIRFELVPAYYETFVLSSDELKIPAPRNKEIKWITTAPKEFGNKVDKKNIDNDQQILPVIRLLKYWNYINGRLFSSYYLEHFIIEHSYSSCNELKDYFYEVISDLNKEQNLDQDQKKLVDGLYERRRRLLALEEKNIPEYIEQELMSFLPMISN
jgi:predicted nucleotidyltransferase